MAAGRPHDKAQAVENLRVVLGCETHERSIDAAKRVVAERDALLLKVADLERALQVAWENRDAG
jgi:hypothetical protein